MVTTISKSAILCLVPLNIWFGNPSIKEINAKIITPEILSHSIFKSPLFKLEGIKQPDNLISASRIS